MTTLDKDIGRLEGKMDLMLKNQDGLDARVVKLHERIDVHSKWIAGVKATIAFVVFASGYAWWWIKHKIGSN